ncbi:unnamed protein product [Moneuplotes crassus]|uniref:LITAF domain-containing protein n=1 Tax=Euplotes crassus TaxID=5936 RepID=A0AAD2D0I1_EUPCR|nr:unnamed protein product [Moneuplotes crassus]
MNGASVMNKPRYANPPKGIPRRDRYEGNHHTNERSHRRSHRRKSSRHYDRYNRNEGHEYRHGRHTDRYNQLRDDRHLDRSSNHQKERVFYRHDGRLNNNRIPQGDRHKLQEKFNGEERKGVDSSFDNLASKKEDIKFNHRLRDDPIPQYKIKNTRTEQDIELQKEKDRLETEMTLKRYPGAREIIRKCKICGYEGKSNIKLKHSFAQYIFSAILCGLGFWCCFFIPFMCSALSKLNHSCAECGSPLGSTKVK